MKKTLLIKKYTNINRKVDEDIYYNNRIKINKIRKELKFFEII